MESSIAAAAAAGISCILTRDRLFAESATKAIKNHKDLAIVLLTLTQFKALIYLSAFERAWLSKPIEPIPGCMIEWPEFALQ